MRIKILIVLTILVCAVVGIFVYKNLIPLVEKISEVLPEKVKIPPHCADGIYNEGEEGLDCGWSCPNECFFVEKAGPLTKDEVWDGNILVTESVTVPKGISLVIEPGTIVKFQHFRPPGCGGRGSLIIEGTLKAIGTPERRIWFTSDAPDPINGDWFGISFRDTKSPNNIIKYAIIEFGTQNINFWNSSALVSHCIIRYNNWENIYLEFHSSPRIERSMIYDAGYLGIAMEQLNDPIIEYNYISDAKYVFSDYSNPVIRHNVFKKTGFQAASEGVIELYDNTIEGGVQFERGMKSANLSRNDLRGEINLLDIKSVKLNENNIHSNVFVGNVKSVDAIGNWWSTTDEEKIKEKIADPNKILDYSAFLTAPVTGITSKIDFDYEDIKNFKLGYIPGDPEKDRYPYIYPSEDETRRVVRKEMAGEMLWTISWDGEYFYITTDNEVLKVNKDFEVMDKFETISPWLRGMVSDGKYVWVNGYDDGMIHAYNPKTKELVKSFSVADIEGIAKGSLGYADGHLYILVWMPGRLYKYTTDGQRVSMLHVPFDGWGLAHDGQYFYTCCGDRICKFTEEGELKGMVWAGSENCWDLTWADGKLWTIERTNENWRDEKVYQIEIINDQLLWGC